MSTLLAVRTQYFTALEQLQGLGVSVHGGTFTQQELERYSKRAPHAVLTLLGFESQFESGITQAEAQWGLMLFTKQEPGVRRDASCIALAEAITQTIMEQWPAAEDAEQVSRPTDVQARNVYSTPLDAIGIAMWSLEWKQLLDLTVPVEVAEWYRLNVKYDVQPRTDGTEIHEQPEAEDDIAVVGPDVFVDDPSLAPWTDDSGEEYTI